MVCINEYVLAGDMSDGSQLEVGLISGMFLRGPVPLVWIQTAHALGGDALAVGLVLWVYSGINNSRGFQLSSAKIEAALGVSRETVGRAVRSLSEAGLIAVTAAPGQRNTFRVVSG